jgi:uncharacterized secreted protein with C-terminal beta-propeller domain
MAEAAKATEATGTAGATEATGVAGTHATTGTHVAIGTHAATGTHATTAAVTVAATAGSSTTTRRRRSLTIYLSVAAAVFLVFIAAGLLIVNRLSPYDAALPFGSSTRTTVADAGAVRAPADYAELYAVFEEVTRENAQYGLGAFGLAAEAPTSAGVSGESAGSAGSADAASADAASANGGAEADVAAVAPAQEIAPLADRESLASNEVSSDASLASDAGAGDYSKTNVQVEGIDEGDIVKTDGSYIYVLSQAQGELVIFEAAGSQTSELSRVSVAEMSLSLYQYPQEMYVNNSTLVIVKNRFNGDVVSSAQPAANSEETCLVLYDVSDPSNPTLMTEFSQSGNYRNSRLYGDRLYLISSYYLSYGVERDNPVTYVPQVGKEGSYDLMAIADVRVMPSVQQPNYTVVTSYDLTARERVDQKAVLGEATTVYMSYENLYLGSSLYVNEESEPYQESVYIVVDYKNAQRTQLVRIGIDEGLLDVAAQCTFDGRLLNQFSLDEYEGNLRLAVTHETYSYRVLRDENYGVESYQYDETAPTNAVYVLDPSLVIIGSIEGMAEDERIYSARFTGSTGYMVTYRQMDPLFALDLSDPTNPKVTSELKIPGFSTYLHPFGEGLLLGFGYDATDNMTQGMKLSMFDISDPFAVGELFAEKVDTYDSEALSEHKAVLVDVDRNIIGFPGYGSSSGVQRPYFVYRYDGEGGFELRAQLELGATTDQNSSYYGYYGGCRGLFIGGYLYVFSGDYLDVFDLEALKNVASLKVADLGGQSIMPMSSGSLILE